MHPANPRSCNRPKRAGQPLRHRPILPDDHNGKVENVPSIAEVRVRMHCESIGDDFQDALEGENNHKYIFDVFL